MAIPKNGLIIIALLLTTIVLETGRFSGHFSPVHYDEEHLVSREKRETLPAPIEYDVDVELNITDFELVDYLKRLLDGTTFPLALGPTVNVTHIAVTTVCSSNGTSFQCRCEEQYGWSYTNCITYGACDSILGGTCRCINSIPTNGEYCQPQTVLPIIYEYQVFIEVKTTDADTLRNTLNNTSFPIEVSTQLNISEANFTTVCSYGETGIQCQCEDEYLWPCDKCATYGECDGNTTSTCGCIKAFPRDGQYCQSVEHHNFTTCPPSTAAPPLLYEYVISVEISSDVTQIQLLLSFLRDTIYPFKINGEVQIYDVNISTVCSPSSSGYQCRCEDQYRWPCDHCVKYGTCDNITEDTCGCINTIPPDGQHCQPADQLNLTACTPPTNSTPTVPPTVNVTIVYEYVISIELNTTDVAVIELLRNISYPINITANVQVSDLNITTICSPSSSGYQCKCEDQYRWPCDHCVKYGTCDNITEDTCGCINTIPPDGQHCQPADQLNLTACTPPTNSTPTVPPTVNVTNSTTAVTTISTTIATTTPIVNTTTPTMPTNSTPTVTPTANVTTTPIVNTTTPTMPTNSTTAVTTISTTIATSSTPTVTPTANVTSFNVIMSIELNKTYIRELNNKSSIAYQKLETEINNLLVLEYKKITGFLSVSVIGFRNGSTFADFLVRTTQIIPDEVASANKNLTNTIVEIAPVIGQVTALYESPTPLSLPDLTYTGQPMVLMCKIPDNLNVGNISGSMWTFNGTEINENSKRITISTSPVSSNLTINTVILLDTGLYECYLTGGIISFNQKRNVTTNAINQAPNIQLQSQINVECKVGGNQPLQCCVQRPYTVTWFKGLIQLNSDKFPINGENCIKYNYRFESCSESQPISFICKVDNPSYEKETKMFIFNGDAVCHGAPYGVGQQNDLSTIRCDKGQEGFKMAKCVSGTWTLLKDTCILTEINELLILSKDLMLADVPNFVANLSEIVRKQKSEIVNSSATISAIVDIIGTIANITGEVSEAVIKDVLKTVNDIIGDDSKQSWAFLNANETSNSSSSLLGALETLANRLVGKVEFVTERVILNRTTFNNSFMAELHSNVSISLPSTNLINFFITTITFPSFNNVMPVRNSSFNGTSNETVIDNAINGAVVLVQINAKIRNVSLSYKKLNNSLSKGPQCVFWNFTLFDNLGAWDNNGCKFVSDINNTVTCNCNHLTSFSILMSTKLPPDAREALDIITYFGIGISLASLVICLIIEGYVWKAVTRNSTAFMRHVSIINTALSLLIADICFIIGAFLVKKPIENPGQGFQIPLEPCSTATFFIHFFYLALFFWMLVSGLLLFYRTVMVFSHMSRTTMLVIGFLLGYGCPLIIAVITVAVTAPGKGYIREDNACWLNWSNTHALLAMVIPALTIVSINIVIVIVVLVKMLRRGVGDAAQTDERHTLVVILRCVVILTPLFGLTWSLGIGTMVSTEKGIHIAFALFNSLQGFFILVFGTLFDSKIRSILSRRSPTSSTGSNNTTRSTSGGISSHSGLNWINRLRRRRYIYHVSETANSNTGASESFTNI